MHRRSHYPNSIRDHKERPRIEQAFGSGEDRDKKLGDVWQREAGEFGEECECQYDVDDIVRKGQEDHPKRPAKACDLVDEIKHDEQRKHQKTKNINQVRKNKRVEFSAKSNDEDPHDSTHDAVLDSKGELHVPTAPWQRSRS